MQIVRYRDGLMLAERGVLARTIREQSRGLLGTRSLPEGEALVLEPCNSVHMLGMRYPLYVIYLDRDNRVVWEGVLRPWRFGPLVRRARKVIELPAGMAGWLAVGDIIDFLEEGLGHGGCSVTT